MKIINIVIRVEKPDSTKELNSDHQQEIKPIYNRIIRAYNKLNHEVEDLKEFKSDLRACVLLSINKSRSISDLNNKLDRAIKKRINTFSISPSLVKRITRKKGFRLLEKCNEHNIEIDISYF